MYYHNNHQQPISLIPPRVRSGLQKNPGSGYGAHFSGFGKSGLIIFLWLYSVTLLYSQALAPTFSNVDYAGFNNVNQKLDIYIPPGLTSPAPVIVFIHGGGWSTGSKGPENIPFFQMSYDSGFICVDINYRLSTDSVWPAQINDCKAAIRFLKAHALTYNIDICRFGVIGESAGGHLAAMLGTSAGVKTLEGMHLGNTNQSSRVQAVVTIYGPTDFLREDANYPASCGTSWLIHEYNSFETQMLGIDNLHNHKEIVRGANPMTYITTDDARFFIIHGAEDCIVPAHQSVLLDSALSAAGIPADTLIIAEGQNHGNPFFKDNVRTILYNNFFLEHLSTPCAPIGINETIFNNILIFPIPARSEIVIDLPFTDKFKIEILNTFGNTILRAQNQNTINISRLKSGIYILNIITVYGVYSKKIIKR